ncbi:MAG: hypothetical protein ABJF67_01460 [Aurantimonas coralicida]
MATAKPWLPVIRAAADVATVAAKRRRRVIQMSPDPDTILQALDGLLLPLDVLLHESKGLDHVPRKTSMSRPSAMGWFVRETPPSTPLIACLRSITMARTDFSPTPFWAVWLNAPMRSGPPKPS